jgi:4-hydroxythreonine-4-phosphate dehydrogenase
MASKEARRGYDHLKRKNMKRILLTSGDPNGVGLEVTAKALEKLGPQKGVQFILFRSSDSELKQLKRIDKKFNRIVVKSLEEAFSLNNLKASDLIDIESSESAPRWVEVAATACHKKHADGMVTAPLSKTLIQKQGYNAKGHTEILQKISGAKDVHMVFIGKEFNVLLATGHVAIEKISETLTTDVLEKALTQALNLRKILPKPLQKRPVALVGLNPHAGESGILGKQEIELFSPLIKKFKGVVGPLVPDAAFLKQNWKKFSVFVCPYHDQGLIPFKMIHGTEGFHLTYGLSFLRTSVDHGTAFDIYGKNKADGSSMLDAIRACIAMSR